MEAPWLHFSDEKSLSASHRCVWEKRCDCVCACMCVYLCVCNLSQFRAIAVSRTYPREARGISDLLEAMQYSYWWQPPMLEDQFEPGSHLHTHLTLLSSQMWLKTGLYVWLMCFCESKLVKRWKNIRPSAGLGSLIDTLANFCEIKFDDTISQWPLCPVRNTGLRLHQLLVWKRII